MPANIGLSWENAIDAASIAASSEAGLLPAANLTSARYKRDWRSLATTASFTARFSATAVGVLALAGCTLAESDTIRHVLQDAGGATLLDATVDSDVAEGYGLHVYVLASAVPAATSWTCTVTAASRASQGYFDIARAWAAPLFVPSSGGILAPMSDTWDDQAEIVRARRSGAVFVSEGPQQRKLDVQVGYIADADKVYFKEMARVAGCRRQILCIPQLDGDIPTEAILGRMEHVQPIQRTDYIVPAVYGQQLNLIEDVV